MINRHPESDQLLEYAAGSLSSALCIAVTTHLQFCDLCRDAVKSLGEIAGEMLTTTTSVPVSADLFDKVMSDIETTVVTDTPRRHHNAPSCSDDISTALPVYVQKLLPDGNLNWRRLSTSLKVAPVSVGEDQYELALHHIKAGGKAPAHDHRGRETTVVLTGSFSDEDGIYQPGDFIVREPGDTHRPCAARHQACICLSVLEAPIRLTGIKRVLNPFLSFSPG